MAGYEFSEAENARLGELRQTIMHISILCIAFGVLEVVGSFFVVESAGRWISLVAGMLFLALGWLYARPLDNLRRVLHSKGQDIRQVLVAFSDLRIAYLGGEVILVVLVATIIVAIMRLVS